MSKQLLIFAGVGVLVIATAIFFVFTSTKGAHLELKGQILKIRSGALDDQSSAAVLDFRVENPSDVPFVVREVNVVLEKQDGSTADALIVSKADLNQLLQYNKFLGQRYNEVLTLRDKVPPHATVDRMVAVRFEVPSQQLDNGKAIRLQIQDVDGTTFETSHPVK